MSCRLRFIGKCEWCNYDTDVIPARVKQHLYILYYGTAQHFLLLLLCMSVASVPIQFIILCAKLSGTVYCYRSCLWRVGGMCLWVCYHDNSKFRASIFTKLGL